MAPVPAPAQDKPVHIGFLLDNLKHERWQRDSKLVQARAHDLGVKITVKDAEGNDDLQLQQANQLLDAGANVLIARVGKPDTSDKISNGTYTVPPNPPPSNLRGPEEPRGGTIISDGFHTADEVKKALAPGEWEKLTARTH